MNDEIRVRREELFAPEVTRILERESRLKGRRPPESAPISPIRRLLMAPGFHLPVAGLLAALAAWAVLEPRLHDMELVGGQVNLVNRDPFVAALPGAINLTVGSTEVIVVPDGTRLEAGADGQPPFASIKDVEAKAFIEAAGIRMEGNRVVAFGLRPATKGHATGTGAALTDDTFWKFLLFPLTALLVAFALLLAEGATSRNWVRMAERMFLGLLLTLVFSLLGFIPAGIAMTIGQSILEGTPGTFVTVENMPAVRLVLFVACRSLAWASIGAAAGVGMNLTRSTKAQLRNTVIGGALGGALGGLFFDPIDRFVGGASVFDGAGLSRLVGIGAVGLSIGFFVALVERLAREAWLRVRTGPLAGKQFVLYRTPTQIGSAPQADIYLFKDSEIDGAHAAIHRVGNRYEVEDMGSRHGTDVGGRPIRRHRLVSGDTITVGSTVLEFEERAKRGVVK